MLHRNVVTTAVMMTILDDTHDMTITIGDLQTFNAILRHFLFEVLKTDPNVSLIQNKRRYFNHSKNRKKLCK